MVHFCVLVRRHLTLMGLVLFSGCCTDQYFTSSCGTLPSEQVSAIEVTIRTGREATNADIYFCYDLLDSTTANCQILDTSANNFEEGRTEVFLVRADFDGQTFDTFWIENRGGRIFEGDWDIDALTVTLRTASGGSVLYDEPGIICNEAVNEGDTYSPGGCTWR